MSPKNKSTFTEVEVIPPADYILQKSGLDAATLDRLVEKRVAEVLANREDFALEPFFRTRRVACEIRRLQTVPQLKKWSAFYERHGCLICHKNDLPHQSCGMCRTCHVRTAQWLKAIEQELLGETGR